MKIVTRITVVGVVLGVAFHGAPLWATQDDAAPPALAVVAPAPIVVTRDNFVSLSWRQTGGFAGITSTAEVKGNVISRSNPRVRQGGENGAPRGPRLPETRGLSNKQLDQLIDKIKEANLPALVGNYRQQGLMDGFNETLTLTLSDENGEDRDFVIQNYGDTAPRPYLDFVTYFRGMLDKKFAPARTPLEAG